MKNPDELERKALDELQQFPPLPWEPLWHPYYWMGYLAAAKAMGSSGTAAAPRTVKRSSSSRRRAGG